MKRLITCLFVIATLILSTQLVRHFHLLAFGDEGSMLDTYEAYSGDENQIEAEYSTELLLEEYGELKPQLNEMLKGKDWSGEQEVRSEHPDLFARCDLLERELRQREQRMNDLRDLWLFSGAGMLLIVAGILIVRRGEPWVAVSLMVAGFCELLWWSKPDFFTGGAFREYGFLLQSKIVISLIAVVSLLGLWKLRNGLFEKQSSKGTLS